MKSLVSFVLVLHVGSSALAQPEIEDFIRLVNAKSVRCEFDRGAQAAWKGGKLGLELASFGEGGKVTFDSIDAKAGTARLIGNAGAGDIVVLATPAGLSFLEQTGGGLVFTTVFAEHSLVSGLRFIAVQSRHLSLWTAIAPSQYHGTCTILE